MKPSTPTDKLRRALIEAYWCYNDTQAELYSVRNGRIFHREIELSDAEIASEPKVFREICGEFITTKTINQK